MFRIYKSHTFELEKRSTQVLVRGRTFFCRNMHRGNSFILLDSLIQCTQKKKKRERARARERNSKFGTCFFPRNTVIVRILSECYEAGSASVRRHCSLPRAVHMSASCSSETLCSTILSREGHILCISPMCYMHSSSVSP
jgi:hypothetical protein